MDILGYEIDIYLVIAATAAFFVFGIIYLMISGSRKKPAKAKRQQKKEKAEKILPKGTETEMSDDEFEQEPQLKLPQRPQLAPPQKPPEESKAADEEKPGESAIPSAVITKEEDQESQLVDSDAEKAKSTAVPGIKAVSDKNSEENTKEKTVEKDESSIQQIKASEIAPVTDEKQEKDEDEDNDENKESDSLDDIFSMEEEEDSDTSNLAATLEEIDVSTLKKMTEELSQIISGNSRELPRR